VHVELLEQSGVPLGVDAARQRTVGPLGPVVLALGTKRRRDGFLVDLHVNSLPRVPLR
jgi:hypothetical protein